MSQLQVEVNISREQQTRRMRQMLQVIWKKPETLLVVAKHWQRNVIMIMRQDGNWREILTFIPEIAPKNQGDFYFWQIVLRSQRLRREWETRSVEQLWGSRENKQDVI